MIKSGPFEEKAFTFSPEVDNIPLLLSFVLI